MKIGILGAMHEEISSIKEIMLFDKETTIAGRVYYEGQINGIEVVLVFSRWGKVASAITTTTLINKFKVNFVLFTGVAGAVSEHLNIGDIVVGSGLYQHDMDARPFFDQFQIPLTSTIVFEPRFSDIENIAYAAKRFANTINTFFEKALLARFSIVQPSVHIGLIASGDRFVADPLAHENLTFNSKNDKTLAVEMEGAAVAQVCEDHNIAYLVLRVISDKADHSAAINFQDFVREVASKYSSGIVKEYLSSMK